MALSAPQKDNSSRSSPSRRSIFRRRGWILALLAPVLLLGLWTAIHRFPWLGPWLSQSLRAVIGVQAVTKLQDFAYGVQDDWNQFWRSGEAPRAHWKVEEREKVVNIADAGASPETGGPKPPPRPLFQPVDVGPVHKSWSAPGDGVWIPISDPRSPDSPPVMAKTLLHPDRNRSWAELFVVAIDLRQVQLHLVAGYQEPKSFEREGVRYKRPAKISPAHHETLLAAFNGGFRTEHGWYGMRIDEVTLVKPRKNACTVVRYTDESLVIASWKLIAETESQMLWWRQTPGCMYENGVMHTGLKHKLTSAWGATLDGETVIRRSAIGLSQDRKTLFVSISNSTTAHALAFGMHHAGAVNVAQLDVNWSYPKFVLFEPGEGGAQLNPVALAKGFEFSPDEYIRRRSMRDFFYLTKRKSPWTPEDGGARDN